MATVRHPPPLSDVVTRQMKRMPRASSGPELALRSELHRRGLRFRVNHPGLPGRPDIVFTRARLAVFVDGCFWHQCPQHCVMPKNNRSWWEQKLRGNVERDRRKDAGLTELGWTVVHVWEHDPVDGAADHIEALRRARIAGPVVKGQVHA